MVYEIWSPQLFSPQCLQQLQCQHCRTKKSSETFLGKNQTGKLSSISEAQDVVDNIVVDCKVLFLQCLGSDHLVYLIWKIVSVGAKLPCYCFHFVLFLKRFSCQLNTFSDTPLPPSLLVLFSFHLALIDNILMPVCTRDKTRNISNNFISADFTGLVSSVYLFLLVSITIL